MAKERVNPLRRFKLLERATRIKWNKYTWSGLIIIAVGIVLIAYALALRLGAYSVEGLLVGFGAIIVVVGLIRVLIGMINPATPEDLNPPTETPEEALFEEDGI